MKKVTTKTRAGKNGRQIYCPKCNRRTGVGHFSWSSLHCDGCGQDVKKTEWLTEETPAEILGKKGGQVKSEVKTKAVRENASKPRGKWATAISYEITYATGVLIGVLLLPGKMPTKDDKFHDKVILEIEKKTGEKVEELLECSTVSRLI